MVETFQPHQSRETSSMHTIIKQKNNLQFRRNEEDNARTRGYLRKCYKQNRRENFQEDDPKLDGTPN